MATESTDILTLPVNEEKPDTKSQDWNAMEPFWRKVTDIVDGEDAIKAGKTLYLPQFPHENDKDYALRIDYGKFTNVYRDVLEGLALKPFSHEVTALADDMSERLADLIEDIDGRGNHLHVFSGITFYNGINKAIDWILVDYTKTSGLRTVEQEREAGARPYWVHVAAEDVIWAESEIIQGREQLTKVKILEGKGKVRTFERDSDGTVTWRLEIEKRGAWVVDDEGPITIGVIPMVPFITGRRKGKSWQFHPPMKDAADLQIKLYQNETDLEYIKAMTCFPMLSGNGVTPEMQGGKPKAVPVGPKAVLYAPMDSDGNHGEWDWIITSADCLKFLAGEIKQTKLDLRELGRQPLTAQSGNLTVITTAFAAQKGNSALQAWTFQLKDALENALKITAAWLGIDEEPTVSVFSDFGIGDEDEKAPEHLLKLRENNDLSQLTLWEEFQRRGILGPEFDPTTEVEERLFQELPGDDI